MRFTVISMVFMAVTAIGCGGPCKDLEAKKGDCAKAGLVKATCETTVDAAIKAGNADACKAMIGSVDTMVKAAAAVPAVPAAPAAPAAP